MNKINKLLTLLSLTAIAVSIERFSHSTRIFLQPYNFLRIHEVFQISIMIFLGVIISFFIMKEITNNFDLLKDKIGTIYALMFLSGLYFCASGNGLHEVSSHFFNTFCNTKTIENTFCGAAFINNYYFGNGMFFFGFLLSNLSLVLMELRKQDVVQGTRNILITLVNSSLFSLSLVAYAGFDRVQIGLYFLLISLMIFSFIAVKLKHRIFYYPFTLYCAFAYSTAALVSFVIWNYHAYK